MKKKIWIFVLIGVPFFLALCLVISIYWVLNSPTALKSSLEWGIARLTHAPVIIERLDIFHRPYYGVKLYGLHLNLEPERFDSYFEAEEAAVQFSLTGPFGEKILWVEELQFEQPMLKLATDMKWPAWETSSPSTPSTGFIDTLFSKLLFQDVRLKSAVVTNGGVEHRGESRGLSVTDFNVYLHPSSGLIVDGGLSIVDKHYNVILPALYFDGSLQYHPTEPITTVIEGELFLMAGRICAENAVLNDVRGRTRLYYDTNDRRLSITAFKLQSLAESLPDGAISSLLPQTISMDLEGEIKLSEEKLYLSQWRLSAGELVAMQGKATTRWKKPIQAAVTVEEGWLDMHRIQPLLIHQDAPADFQLIIKDKVELSGQGTLYSDNNRYRLASTLNIGLRDNFFAFRQKEAAVQGRLGGHIHLNGTWPGTIDFGGQLEADAIEVSTTSLDLNHLSVGGRFKGQYPEVRFKDLWGDLPAVDLPVNGKRIQLENLKFSVGEALWNFKSSEGRLPGMQVSSDFFHDIIIRLNHVPSTTKISINTDGSGLLSIFEELTLLPEGWRLAGHETLQADVIFDTHSQMIKWQMGCDLKNLSFENQDQSIISEQIGLFGKTHGSLSIKEKTANAVIDLEGTTGEILLDQFYLNLKEHPVHFGGALKNSPSDSEMIFEDGVFELGELAQLDFAAKRYLVNRDAAWKLHLSLSPRDIAPLYALGIREPFGMEKPFLTTLELGGTLFGGIDVDYQSQQWEITGNWGWEDGFLKWAEQKILLEGINVNFPVWLTSSVGKSRSQLNGSLSIDSMEMPFLAKQSLFLPLIIRPNHLSIPDKTILEADGSGRFIVWPVETGITSDGEVELDTRLTIEQWRFDAGLARWWPSQGPLKINADFDSVVMRKGRLVGQGELRTDLFGGYLGVKNAKILNLYSPTPVLGMDLTIEKMDLAPLTNGTGFGKIEGLLNGRVDDLEMVKGQPQRFHLRLETVSEKGVPQKISVEAVESIARIGGGQSPFMGLAGTFASLFKKFGYKKIGIEASLENDMFKVNGLVHENDREYLVKKSGLSGVDVVNSNPDNRIGFKDMVKRIKRVLNPNARPVVK